MPDDRRVNVTFGVHSASMADAMRTFAKAMRQLEQSSLRALQAMGAVLRPYRLQLVVDDPATWRPRTVAGVLAQMRAIVLHEFWLAADRPERSPGARYVRAYNDGRRVAA